MVVLLYQVRIICIFLVLHTGNRQKVTTGTVYDSIQSAPQMCTRYQGFAKNQSPSKRIYCFEAGWSRIRRARYNWIVDPSCEGSSCSRLPWGVVYSVVLQLVSNYTLSVVLMISCTSLGKVNPSTDGKCLKMLKGRSMSRTAASSSYVWGEGSLLAVSDTQIPVTLTLRQSDPSNPCLVATVHLNHSVKHRMYG